MDRPLERDCAAKIVRIGAGMVTDSMIVKLYRLRRRAMIFKLLGLT